MEIFFSSKYVICAQMLCAFHYSIGQARMDGAICEYSQSEQQSYLQKLKEHGVNNIEMECSAMASLCHKAGVRSAIVCVVLVDRLNGDQVDIPPETYHEWQLQPQNLVVHYIKTKLTEMKTENAKI